MRSVIDPKVCRDCRKLDPLPGKSRCKFCDWQHDHSEERVGNVEAYREPRPFKLASWRRKKV